MCGICGYINFEQQNQAGAGLLQAMGEQLRHRGPDESGYHIDGPCGLMNLRLSILDLQSGRQPIRNEDQTIWVIQNGEIYNFQELRAELIKAGHRFYTRGDTEVLVHLYEAYGDDFISKLDGMFALALWDARQRRLLLARDRVGKKPLFYYHGATEFIFASEIKSLLAHPGVPRELDLARLPELFTYGYVPSPHSIFKGIQKLLPGHVLEVKDGKVKSWPYWQLAYENQMAHAEPEHVYIDAVRDLVKKAVHKRLISDVPLGAFLSGGIDSSIIVGLMSELMTERVKTFSLGFEGDSSFDELPYARIVAKKFNTDHHEFVVKPEVVDLLPKIIRHFDEPFGDSSAIPTYLVSQLTRQFVTVALTGDGGDEIFAGYDRFLAAHQAGRLPAPPRWLRKRALEWPLSLLGESTNYGNWTQRAKKFLRSWDEPLPSRYLRYVAIFQPELVEQLLHSEHLNGYAHHLDAFFGQVKNQKDLEQVQFVHFNTSLPDQLLVKTDRMSMANSLEARCPFLDRELLEFCFKLPVALRIKGLSTKYILKRAYRDLLPAEILQRRKHGFNSPVASWFRGPLAGFVQEILTSERMRQRGYVRPELVSKLLREHLSGKQNHGNPLWLLLKFELWCRQYLDESSGWRTDNSAMDGNMIEFGETR